MSAEPPLTLGGWAEVSVFVWTPPLTFTISLMHLSWRWLTGITAARRASGSLNLFFTLNRRGQRAARRCRHAGPRLTMTHLWQDGDNLIDIPPLTARHKFTVHKQASWIRFLCRLCTMFVSFICTCTYYVYWGSLHLGLNWIETWRTLSLFLVLWLDFSFLQIRVFQCHLSSWGGLFNILVHWATGGCPLSILNQLNFPLTHFYGCAINN